MRPFKFTFLSDNLSTLSESGPAKVSILNQISTFLISLSPSLTHARTHTHTAKKLKCQALHFRKIFSLAYLRLSFLSGQVSFENLMR